MENVLSCAAVLARPGHHWPQSWCVRCEVWRLKIWRSQLGVVLLIFMIYCQSPAFILSSDTNWSAQINYSDTFNFQNTKKWKWSLPCLNTSSSARLSGHQWTVSWKMNTDHGDQIFSVGGCKYMLSSLLLSFYLHISHINSLQTFTPLHITILTLQYGTITSHDQAIHWQSPIPFHSWITLPTDSCCRRCWWNGFSVKSWNVTTVMSGLQTRED